MNKFHVLLCENHKEANKAYHKFKQENPYHQGCNAAQRRIRLGEDTYQVFSATTPPERFAGFRVDTLFTENEEIKETMAYKALFTMWQISDIIEKSKKAATKGEIVNAIKGG